MWMLNIAIQWLISLILSVVAAAMGSFNQTLSSVFSNSGLFAGVFLGGSDNPPLIGYLEAIGCFLAIALFILGIVRSIMAGLGFLSENPIKMVGRFVVGVCLTFFIFGFISDYLFSSDPNTHTIFSELVRLSTSSELIPASKKLDFSLLESAVSVGTILLTGMVLQIFIAFLAIAILINFVKLLLEMFERYILVNILVLFSPLAPCAMVLESTMKIFSSYLKFIFGQLMILWLDNILFTIAVNALNYASAALFTINSMTSILAMLAILAFMKIFQRVDNYMRDLGLLVGITGGSLLTEIIGTGKTFSSLGKFGGKAAKGVFSGSLKAAGTVAAGVATGGASAAVGAVAGAAGAAGVAGASGAASVAGATAGAAGTAGASGVAGAASGAASGASGIAGKSKTATGTQNNSSQSAADSSLMRMSLFGGVGGVALNQLATGIKGFKGSYTEARSIGFSKKQSIKAGFSGFNSGSPNFGRNIADAAITPKGRTAVVNLASKFKKPKK